MLPKLPINPNLPSDSQPILGLGAFTDDLKLRQTQTIAEYHQGDQDPIANTHLRHKGPSMDAFTDLQLLDELIRRARARLRADMTSRAAQALINALRGAKTFLLLLSDAEADHAKR